MVASTLFRRSTSCGLLAVAALAFASACSEPAPPPPPPAPVVKTAEERTAWYQECWNRFNNKTWDTFQECYDANAVSESVDAAVPSVTGRAAIIVRGQAEAMSFPDRKGEVRLILGNGDKLVSVALYTATNTAPLPPGPDGKPGPTTGKPVGFIMAHSVDLDPTGSFALRDAAYIDEGTMMSQLGLNPAPARKPEKASGAAAMVFTAKNDATETANLTATRAMFEALNKHDLKAIDAMTPPDYNGHEVAKDMNRAQAMASTKEMFGAFPDVKITPATMWAAGVFVVITGTFEGTNTGDMPSMGLKKTGKKVSSRFLEIIRFDGGQAKDDWLFYNGAAWAAQLGLK